MFLVVTECNIIPQEGEKWPTTFHKSYSFTTEDAAMAFIDKFESLPRPTTNDEVWSCVYIGDVKNYSDDDEPLFLYTVVVKYDEQGEIIDFFESMDPFSTGEIEEYRQSGEWPSLVYTYDNPEDFSPRILNEQEVKRRGYDFYIQDGTKIYMSFNPDAAKIIANGRTDVHPYLSEKRTP